MLFIQFTGLSGSGKSTTASGVKEKLILQGIKVEIIDAHIFRPKICRDLAFSKADCLENIRRLGFVASLLAANDVVVILAAINPYEEVREELIAYGPHVKTVLINCDLETLIKRDTKQLYKRALLPDDHPDKLNNLTGVNYTYDIPIRPDLIINTNTECEDASIEKLLDFIFNEITT